MRKTETTVVSVSQDQVDQQTKPQRTLGDVLRDYESSFETALSSNDNDEEAGFDIACARNALVDEGLSLVATISDCDQILSAIGYKDEGLRKLVWEKRDSLEFIKFIGNFDRRHKVLLEQDTSSDEDSEAFTVDRCNELRVRYLIPALKKANTQKECLEVLDRTIDCPDHAYIRQLVTKRMALLPVDVRK